MNAIDAMWAFVDALEAIHVPYIVVGSFSSNLYGIPRSTQDGDFVVQLGNLPVNVLAQRLGPEFCLEPQMRFETITGSHCYVFNMTAHHFKIEVFLLQDEEYHRTRFARRRRMDLGGKEAWVPSVEDVIVTKLRWSRQGQRHKDIEDVTNVLAVQQKRGTPLDWAYIHHWCDRHGTRELLEQVRRSIPPL